MKPTLPILASFCCFWLFAAAQAQTNTDVPPRPPTNAPSADSAAVLPERPDLILRAGFSTANTAIQQGLHWRIFNETSREDGSFEQIASSEQAEAKFKLPTGAYIVHVAFGLASATKRIVVDETRLTNDSLALNAGALKVMGLLGDTPIAPSHLSIAIFVPERGNSEAKLVLAKAHPGDLIFLPEGAYHIVSTYLDTSFGRITVPTPTNSVVNADLKIETGKVTEATLRHHAALVTLKLVNAPQAEALANTSFTVLTPGGDVIRELIGAFPQLMLAEGEYIVIARHEGKTYQQTIKVDSILDHDIDILTQNQAPAAAQGADQSAEKPVQ